MRFDVKSNSPFGSQVNKTIWKENLAIYQKPLGAFFQAPLQFCVETLVPAGRPALFATSDIVSQEDKRMNNRTMLPALKNSAAAGYQGPVKIELLKGADLLVSLHNFFLIINFISQQPFTCNSTFTSCLAS